MSLPIPQFSRRSHERGVIVIYVAIMALVIIGLVGFALDGAFVSRTSQQLQHAADAAALNAVRYLNTETDPFTDARTAAINIALANEAARLTVKLDANTANVDTGDIVVGHWDVGANTFTPTVTNPNAVRVRAKRTSTNADGPLSLLFGPVFGKDASDVGVMATAVMAASQGPLVLVLDPGCVEGTLDLNGNNALDVLAGSIHVNSCADCAIDLHGTPTMSAQMTTVVGTACGELIGPKVEGADILADPLANVLPTVADWNAFKASLPTPLGPNGKIGTSGTFNPGYYPEGLNANGAAITLNPGNYMFGKEVKLNAGCFVTGAGVTIFFDKGADLSINGSGAGVNLTPSTSGPFEGIVFFTHRENTGKKVFQVGGSGSFFADGITYVPSGLLEVSGNPGKEFGAIIAWHVATKGVTGFIITGSAVPSGPDAAYLVE